MIGRRVGSWVLEHDLGRGGMGTVFLARHASLALRAAVKVLSPGLESEESFRERFRREADLQARLRHPNVARVLDYLEEGGQWFLVVELLERGSLADLLTRQGGRVPRASALSWTRQALAGLGYAHQQGVVHRDVKPANLLLNERDEVAVADFGIALAAAEARLTTTGIAVGTPQYMSPEQILTPQQVDRRTDVYAMGIVLYELLAGRTPFGGDSQFSILQAHVSQQPPPLRTVAPDVAPALEAVVLRALAKRLDDRYADCDSMIADLDLAAAGVSSLALGSTRVLPLPVPPAGLVAPGATVRASRLMEVPLPEVAASSPAEQRERRRRSFRRRLAVGAVLALAVAAVVASQMPLPPDPAPEVTPPVAPTAPPPPPTAPPAPTTASLVGWPPPVGKPSNVPPVPVDPAYLSTDAARMAPPMPNLTPPSLSLPAQPRVAVVASGDPILAASLEQEMERRLASRFDVADERADAEVDELLGSGAAAPARAKLGAQLLRGGFHVLVVVRVEEGERRTFEQRGISGSIKAARLRLTAYLLVGNRPLGRGWTELVEYTELSAAAKARAALIGATAELIADVDAEWSRLGGRS